MPGKMRKVTKRDKVQLGLKEGERCENERQREQDCTRRASASEAAGELAPGRQRE